MIFRGPLCAKKKALIELVKATANTARESNQKETT